MGQVASEVLEHVSHQQRLSSRGLKSDRKYPEMAGRMRGIQMVAFLSITKMEGTVSKGPEK